MFAELRKMVNEGLVDDASGGGRGIPGSLTITRKGRAFLKGHSVLDGKNGARKATVRKSTTRKNTAAPTAQKFRNLVSPESKETGQDGLRFGRSGEGENHRKLREWVRDNPGAVEKRLAGARAETEVELLSGDCIDGVIDGESETVAVEVKSRDSNWADLKRGIYQCVKYRAVLRTQDDRLPVRAWLGTEKELSDHLEERAKELGVERKSFIRRPLAARQRKERLDKTTPRA